MNLCLSGQNLLEMSRFQTKTAVHWMDLVWVDMVWKEMARVDMVVDLVGYGGYGLGGYGGYRLGGYGG